MRTLVDDTDNTVFIEALDRGEAELETASLICPRRRRPPAELRLLVDLVAPALARQAEGAEGRGDAGQQPAERAHEQRPLLWLRVEGRRLDDATRLGLGLVLGLGLGLGFGFGLGFGLGIG